MNQDFYLVHKSILPDGLEKVIECRNLVENKKINVSDACKQVGISRSKYYKYKDLVFLPHEDQSNIAILNLRLKDEKGTLSRVLSCVSDANANIITINQSTPLEGNAIIFLALNIKDMNVRLEDFIDRISKVKGVNSVKLLAVK